MSTKKTRTKVDIATRAVVHALTNHDKKHPGSCIVKPALIPLAVRRANWILDDDDDPMYDEEAITAPTEDFIFSHWQDIGLLAAEKMHKYIIWEPRVGVRLGTFEEYQELRNILAKIAQGVADNVDGRNEIIVKQGGKSFVIEMTIKLLTDGN